MNISKIVDLVNDSKLSKTYTSILSAIYSLKLKKDSAIMQALSVNIDANFDFKAFQGDVQKILDCMMYDKIEQRKIDKFASCSDGWIVYENRQFDISDDTGMCYELSMKTMAYLELMYPDKTFSIVEDKKRPAGCNHYFVVLYINNHSYIIDSSVNRQGYLEETGSWDGSGINYSFNTHYGVGTESFLPRISTFNYVYAGIPLISPRHFDSSSINHFGFFINIHVGREPCFVIKNNNIDYTLAFSSKLTVNQIMRFGKENGLQIPKNLAKKLIEMSKVMAKNTQYSDLTMAEFRIKYPECEILN